MSHHTHAEESGIGEADAGKVHPQQNRLLAALPAGERERLLPALNQVYLPLGSVLYEARDSLHHVHFPTNCIVSLLHELHDGASAGIAAIGNEGAIGVELFMGGDSMTNRAVVQNAGFAYRMPAAQFKQEFQHHDVLFCLLLRYTQALITQVAQTVVCNRHHPLDQRLCRWLAETLDRMSSNKLTMTQDLIANILGVRREGITMAARKLVRQDIISYRRGQITVLDRPRLEELSCECYGIVKKETDRLLPRTPQTAPAGTAQLSRASRRARAVNSRSAADAINLTHPKSSDGKDSNPLE